MATKATLRMVDAVTAIYNEYPTYTPGFAGDEPRGYSGQTNAASHQLIQDRLMELGWTRALFYDDEVPRRDPLPMGLWRRAIYTHPDGKVQLRVEPVNKDRKTFRDWFEEVKR
jgi:hypothetical protein